MVVSQRIPCEVHPEIAFFAIRAEHFESDEGWRGLIDLLARHGMYNLITVTMRLKGHAITEPETRALFGRLLAYARARGVWRWRWTWIRGWRAERSGSVIRTGCSE